MVSDRLSNISAAVFDLFYKDKSQENLKNFLEHHSPCTHNLILTKQDLGKFHRNQRVANQSQPFFVIPLHMKKNKLLALSISTILGGLQFCVAQEAEPVPEVRINKIDVQLVPVPDYSGAGNFRRARDAAAWLQIEVEFDVKLQGATASSPLFLDELNINYYVALLPEHLDGGTKNPHAGKAFSLEITHVDVKTSTPGQSRYSVAYLPGRFLERLTKGKIPPPSALNVAVEIKHKSASTPLAVRTEGPLKNTEGWWNQVEKIPGILLTKDRTPFAPVAWDRHEPMKSGSGR